MPRYIDIEPFETDSSHDWFLIGYKSISLDNYDNEIAKKDLADIPTVELPEILESVWVYEPLSNSYLCKHCHEVMKSPSNFCPNCRRRMTKILNHSVKLNKLLDYCSDRLKSSGICNSDQDYFLNLLLHLPEEVMLDAEIDV